jgi:hypothetical protein
VSTRVAVSLVTGGSPTSGALDPVSVDGVTFGSTFFFLVRHAGTITTARIKRLVKNAFHIFFMQFGLLFR